MKLLSTILKRIEAGGEDAIRAQLNEAIGMWAATHGNAHKIIAISENSVAFADNDANLFVARYVVEGDLVALSKVRRLTNIQEEIGNTDHLENIAAAIVNAVAEEKEDEVDVLIRSALEMKSDALRLAEMADCEAPAKFDFAKKAEKGRFGVAQKAKKGAKKKSFLAAEGIRTLDTSKLSKPVAEALARLPGAAVNMMAAIDCAMYAPVTEGFALATEHGVPSLMQGKGSTFRYLTPAAPQAEEIVESFDEETLKAVLEAEKTKSKVEVHVYDSPADKERKDKFSAKPRHTGKGHSVRYKGKSYRLVGGDKGKGKIYLQSRSYHGVAHRKNAIETKETQGMNEEDQKWRGQDLGNPLDAKRKPINKGGMGKVTEGEGEKFEVKDCGGGKWQVQKAGENGVMDVAGEYDTAEAAAKAKTEFEQKERLAMKGEGVILANLAAVKEAFHTDDFFYRTGVAWASFRAEGIGQAGAEILERQGSAEELLDASPLLSLCSEDEIYEMLSPHLDIFQPEHIRAYTQKVLEAAKSTDISAAKLALLDELNDAQIKEAVLRVGLTSKTMDQLFLEGDQFDFGSADKLGNDNLDDDEDPTGAEQAQQADQVDPGDGMDQDMGDMGGLDDGMSSEPVQFEMPADEARELFRKVLDTISNDIEDDEDFNDLKSKVDDDSAELTGDDIVSILHVIGDYFRAVGKDTEDKAEGDAEKQGEDETLDDMDTKGNEVNADDTEGGDAVPGQDQQAGLDDIGQM